MPTATTNTSSSTASKTKTVGKVAESSSAVNASIADTMSHLTGKRMYRMANGQMVELPADMTAEEAAHLEAEGNAAQKKLGKGPGPKPLPNVKEKSKVKKAKGEGKEKHHGKKGGHDKKGEGKSKGGGAHAGKVGAIKGKVGAWLMAKGAPAIARGQAKLQVLKNNEHTHDDAGTKLSQTEKAVVPPSMEGQSTSNAGQVETVEAKQAPQPSEAVAKQALTQAIQDNIPQSIEDVDNFKSNNKAGQMSAAVSVTINKDKNEVAGTFEDMKKDPPPAKSDVKPETLPPEEVAPATAKMNLGTNTIAPLQKEHTDVSNYTKEADSKLKEEGVSQEQLDMVDSGDLAEANKEKKGMEKKAKTEPQAITQFAQQANKKVDTELQQEENKGRDEIKNQRKQKLNATKQKQQGTKTLIEKKREEVANQINNIYKRAQDKVTKKLADLETIAMQRFDDGNAKATKEFEDNVNRQIDAFKDRRYSGFWGWAKKAKDWLLGMDDLPEVKAIFDNNRTVFVTKVNALVDLITQDNKKVIQECKDELTNARKEIKAFVDKLGPDLKDAGKKAQDEMSSKLDELDKFVNKKEEELQNKLQDKQKAAIKAIDEKIEKMKEAMSGALSKLGKLLLLAAKKFFSWALEKFGFSLAEIDSIINKGAAVLKAIFTQPIQFVKNLMNAAILGFQNFGKNFLKHLKDALFEWLTGSLEGLTLPKVWDFQGIISVGLQMIGISYQNIRKHMVTVMGENVVSGLEKTFTLVKTLITDGPMAAWEQLKEMAGEMRDAFIDAVKDFIKTKIIEQAIQWVVSLFVPGAGIIKAIIGIYDTIVFFINKAKQIMQMISNFLGSISEIAAGNIGAAADAMENGLARGLSLVINFLAQLLHLNGITDKIRNAIQKIRAKVDAVLLKVAQWIADKAKKLFAPVTAKIDQAKEWGQKKIDQAKTFVSEKAAAFLQWWKKKTTVRLKNGETHTIYFEGQETGSVLMMRSTPMTYGQFLGSMRKIITDDTTLSDADKKAKTDAITEGEKTAALIDQLKGTPYNISSTLTPEEQKTARDNAEIERGKQIDTYLEQLRIDTQIIFGDSTPQSKDPQFGGMKNDMGTSMTVDGLTKNHTDGSAPSQAAHTYYDKVKNRADGGRTFYIRGHLLNQQLGGLGKWYNMTILSQATNKEHENLYESYVKRAVDTGGILSYAVTANYVDARSDKQSLLDAIDRSTEAPAVKDAKKEVITYEDYVPMSLTLNASVKVKNGAEFITKELFNTTLNVNLNRNSTQYHLLDGDRVKPPRVNFNSLNSADYAPLIGIDGLTNDMVTKYILMLSKRATKFGVYEVLKRECTGIIPADVIDKLATQEYIYLGN